MTNQEPIEYTKKLMDIGWRASFSVTSDYLNSLCDLEVARGVLEHIVGGNRDKLFSPPVVTKPSKHKRLHRQDYVRFLHRMSPAFRMDGTLIYINSSETPQTDDQFKANNPEWHSDDAIVMCYFGATRHRSGWEEKGGKKLFRIDVIIDRNLEVEFCTRRDIREHIKDGYKK